MADSAALLRFLFFSQSAVMGKVLGIVYRAIALCCSRALDFWQSNVYFAYTPFLFGLIKRQTPRLTINPHIARRRTAMR